MGTKTLVRPDGSTLLVPEEDAGKLQVLGYREQTPEEGLEANIGQGIRDYYTSPSQKALTGAEGVLSGATLGLSNLILSDDDTRDRARYNPGFRLAGELGGAFLSPAGMVGDVAESLAVGTGKIGTNLARGAAEGAVFGAGGAITDAKLNGDPLTAEAILAGVGWGGVYGGGLGAVAGAASSYLTRQAEKEAARLEAEATASKLSQEAKDATRANQDEVRRVDRENRQEMARTQREAQRQASQEARETQAAAKLEDYRAKQAYVANESKKTISDLEAMNEASRGHWDDLHSALNEVKTSSEGAVRQTQDSLKQVQDALSQDTQTKVGNAVKAADQGKAYLDEVTSSGMFRLKGVRPVMRQAHEAYEDLLFAAKQGDHEGFEEMFNKFRDRLKKVEEASMVQAPEFAPFVLNKLQKAEAAVKEVSALAGVSGGLESLPRNIEGFAKLRDGTAEKIGAALDHFHSKAPAEMEGVRQGVLSALGKFQEHLGVSIKGGPGDQFRGLVDVVKNTRRARATQAARALEAGKTAEAELSRLPEPGVKFGPKYEPQPRLQTPNLRPVPEVPDTGTGLVRKEPQGWMSRILHRSAAHGAGYAGEKLAERLGVERGVGRFMAYDIAKNVAFGLLNVKGAMLGHIVSSFSTWAPTAFKVERALGSKLEPLKRRLDGSLDDVNRTRQDLMSARLKEIRDAAYSVPDTLYKGVQPLSPFHPDLAPALHEKALDQFRELYNAAPKDPGNAFSGLQSLHKPSDVETEQFARTYEVFHDPVAVITRFTDTGQITPEAAKALQTYWPELWQYSKVELLNNVTRPGVWDSLGYNQQVNIGLMLGIPLHSTMTTKFIASHQRMFQDRNQLKPTKAMGGTSNPGGRPAGDSPSATQAQRITEH